MSSIKQKRAVTMKDVARVAGVSHTVVTWVMNDLAAANRIPDTTRARVRGIAERLGYKPNIWGRALKTRKSGILGFINSDFTDPNSNEVVKSVGRAARARGYRLLLPSLDVSSRADMKLLEIGVCDGYLLHNPAPEFLKHCRAGLIAERPFCVIGQHMIAEDLPSVEVDNALGAGLAVRHLRETGCAAIGVIEDRRNFKYTAARMEGCRKALGRGPDRIYFRDSNENQFQAGANAIRQWLKLGKLPAGIFAMGDVIALGALSVLYECQIGCPAAVKVVGFDGTPFAQYASPPLTTVVQPYKHMAETVVGMIADIMDGKRLAPRQVLMPPELVVRKSTLNA